MQSFTNRVFATPFLIALLFVFGWCGEAEAQSVFIRSTADWVCDSALSGRNTELTIRVRDFNVPLGGFDFLIGYDQTALVFQQALRSQDFSWEYFTYRTGPFCPDGSINIVAIADLNNSHEPEPEDFFLDGVVARIEFFVRADRDLVGRCFHVGFSSCDCGHNVIASRNGDTMYAATTVPDSCLIDELHTVQPVVYYNDGCICIVPILPATECVGEMGDLIDVHAPFPVPPVSIHDIQQAIRIMTDHDNPFAWHPCADINCDRVINLVDIVLLINYVFRNGPPLDSFCSP